MHFASVTLLFYCTYTVRCVAHTFDPLCNSTLSFANATGVAEYQPYFAQGPQPSQSNNTSGKTAPAYVATTVTEDRESASVWVTTWVNTNSADYSDDARLGYDVCGMALTHIPDNTESRSQNDDGDCTAMLDQACVDGINSAAEKYALRLVLNPPSWANTNTSNISWISKICPDLANMLNSSPPKECSPYFWPNTTWYAATALTESNSSSIYQGCQSRPEAESNLSSPWWSINSGNIHYSEQIYDFVVNHMTPILGIWMTVANAATIGPAVPTSSVALLRCIRPGQRIREGSRIPAALPAPSPVQPFSNSATSTVTSTPLNDNKGRKRLSDACIAGIVVGLVVGGALIGGVFAWWWLRKRTMKQQQKEEEQKTEIEGEPRNDSAVDQKEVWEMPQPVRIHELESERKAAELETKWAVELEGTTPNLVPPPPVSPPSSASVLSTSLSPVSPEETTKSSTITNRS